MRVWLRLIYKFTDNYCHFTTFLRVLSNSKEVFYLSWQNRYPNLKTTCHIKLKIFLRTKLLERLLLAKYLTSVTAALRTVEKKIFFLSLPYPEEISLQTSTKLRKSLKELLNCFQKQKETIKCFPFQRSITFQFSVWSSMQMQYRCNSI